MPGHRRRDAAIHVAAAALVLAGAVAASAGTTPPDRLPAVIAKVAPSPSVGVVLATVASPSAVLTLTARVRDATGVDRVVLGLYDPAGKRPDGRTANAVRKAGTAKDGAWVATVTLPRDSPVGQWVVRGFATDLAGNMTEPDTVYATVLVRQKTRFVSFSATPADAPVGAQLAVAGTLQRYLPGKGWIAYGGKKVQLEFRAAGTETWVKSATRTTDAAGAFVSTPMRSRGPGSWRASWVGTTQRAPAVSTSATIAAAPAPTS